MNRIAVGARHNWQQSVEKLGFVFHTPEHNELYWNEAHAYQFSESEILTVERAANEVYALCLEAVQYVIDHELYADFKIPPYIIPYLEAEWARESPAIYGRFDFAYNGTQPPMLTLRDIEAARDRIPAQVRLETRAREGAWLSALPADTRRNGDFFQFPLPESGIEPLLRQLIEGEAGILSLSIERAGLHDAFVAIAGEAAARQLEADAQGARA